MYRSVLCLVGPIAACRHVPLRAFLVVTALFVTALFAASVTAHAWEPKDVGVRSGANALNLKSALLNESSGVAFSNIHPHCLWSHNDSGGKARLFAFSHSGRNCGRVVLDGVKAIDWEDMASFVDRRPRLLVADVGDNESQRKSVVIYLFDEPDPREKTRVKVFQRLNVRFANGPQNCESVTVDVANRRILLLGKSALLVTMHQIDLPRAPDSSETLDSSGAADASNSPDADVDANAGTPAPAAIDCVTEPIGTLAIPMATGMELCRKSGDLWIASYHHAYRYPADASASLKERLGRVPQLVELPQLKQIESIATDEKGRVWVTSEGVPAKIQRVVYADP